MSKSAKRAEKRRDPLADALADDTERVERLVHPAIGHRQRNPKRNRDWERKNCDVVTFRGDGLKALNVRVKRYAHKYGLTVGETAAKALEVGLVALEAKSPALDYHA